MHKLIPELPSEIISDILSRLPVKCLVRSKCVSKRWCSLISHPEFAKMHLKRTKEDTAVNHQKIFASTGALPCIVDLEGYCDGDSNLLTDQLHFPISYPNDDHIFILGSCNGLVCGLLEFYQLINIWNPSTRESKELTFLNTLDAFKAFYGFGYDSQLDDYKLMIGSISTSTNSHGSNKTTVQVFTLKSNIWRTIEDVCCGIPLHGLSSLANGVLHWLVTRGPKKMPVMISFDLVEEKFLEVAPLRGLTEAAKNLYLELEVLGHWFCLYSDSLSCEARITKESGSEASWTSVLRFNGEQLAESKYWLRLLWVTKNGNVFYDLDGKALVFHNPKEEIWTEFSIDDNEADWFEFTVYIESIVSHNCKNVGFNGLNFL